MFYIFIITFFWCSRNCSSDITNILNGAAPTKLQEQQLYGAYSIIVGVDLANILIPLNCSTNGLTSLVDLLNPQKLFPTSYKSLTVPLYNSAPAVLSLKYPNIKISGSKSSAGYIHHLWCCPANRTIVATKSTNPSSLSQSFGLPVTNIVNSLPTAIAWKILANAPERGAPRWTIRKLRN